MIWSMLVKDVARNKAANTVLVGLFALTILLACTAAGMSARLVGSVNVLFTVARTPDVVQMTKSQVSPDTVDAFAKGHSEVMYWQVSSAAVATGESLWFGDETTPDAASVMEYYFVAQNSSFDLLLGMDNQPVQIEPGQIGVSVYDMIRHHLRIGDKVKVSTASGEMVFNISTFVRDSMMNPAMISSKRFVVAESDLAQVMMMLPQSESLVEFRLTSGTSTSQFMDAYRVAGLPQDGPSVDIGLLRSVTMLSDGLVIVVLLLVSLLLLVIGVISLRFAISTAIQNSFQELSTLKAIGAPQSFIRWSFSAKYLLLAAAASIVGGASSVWLSVRLTAQATQETGGPTSSSAMIMVIVGVSVGLLAVTVGSCQLAVRSLNKVSAAQSLRVASIGMEHWRRWRLASSRTPLSWYFACRDLQLRPRRYLVPLIVFTIAAILVIVPVNFWTTISSTSFVQYMGIGQSDLRFDAPVDSSDLQLVTTNLMTSLNSDLRITQAASFTTYRCAIVPPGQPQTATLVEAGDPTAFPITYLSGHTPGSGEIALSYLNAQELNATIGSTIKIENQDAWQSLHVVGVYQDITNGGKTAKTTGSLKCGTPIWLTINVNVAPGTDPSTIAGQYANQVNGLKVYVLSDYLNQTLGQTLSSTSAAIEASVAVSVLITGLLTAMFTVTLTTTDATSTTLLRCLGIPERLIRRQYVIRLVCILIAGMTIGSIVANTAGQAMVGLLMSSLGAPQLHFNIVPLVSYAACPLLLFLVVGSITWATTRTITTRQPLLISTE